MMQKCPIQGCGRQFQNELTMIEHVKRRHPLQSDKVRQKTTNEMIQKQTKIAQEMNKLPKMQKVIQMSKQKKTLQFQRRSASKKIKELVSIVQNSQIKLNDIITESRQLVEQNTNSRKILKKPSLSKRSSEQISDSKLPTLNQSKVKKLKLQSLKSESNNRSINESPSTKGLIKKESMGQKQYQSQMYSTAPNFSQLMSKKMQSIRSRSKQRKQQTPSEASFKDLSTIQTKGTIQKKTLSSHDKDDLVQSSKNLQKAKPMQRPVKKLLQRSSLNKEKQKVSLVNQPLCESMLIQKQVSQSSPPLSGFKQLSFGSKDKARPIIDKQRKFSKKSPQQQTKETVHAKNVTSIQNEFNWQERTVTIRNKHIQHLNLPQNSQIEYLFVTNCQAKSIDLNECFSIIQLSLNNNCIDNLNFLEQTVNGQYQNIEAIYLDHNQITSLASLPTYLNLKKLSLTFNAIYELDNTLRILAKFPSLQEIDLSFNPIRKQTNYKLSVLSVCRNLKKLDGMVITKFDRQLASQYHKMYHEYLNIIPLSNSPISSEDKFRPSTAVSINYQQDMEAQNLTSELTQQELQKQIQMFQKMIKNTKQQYEIIQEENTALQEEIQSYEENLGQNCEQKQQFDPELYKRLCKQVQELQLLNFLQYASEKELQELIFKKAKQKGVPIEALTAL